jgi:hypothetical protein
MQKCLTPFFMINCKRTFVTSCLQTKLVFSKVMLNIEQFIVGERYAEAKVLDRQGDTINIHIQGGNYGIGLQENLLKLMEKNLCIFDNKDQSTSNSRRKVLTSVLLRLTILPCNQ